MSLNFQNLSPQEFYTVYIVTVDSVISQVHCNTNSATLVNTQMYAHHQFYYFSHYFALGTYIQDVHIRLPELNRPPSSRSYETLEDIHMAYDATKIKCLKPQVENITRISLRFSKACSE